MRILIASDKFRGSLTASEVASALSEGIRSVDTSIQVDVVPIADGGEGTVDAALSAGFAAVNANVSGPIGGPIAAAYGVRGQDAVIELAAASGLGLLASEGPAPMTATSRGTGELIQAALDHGCTTIVLGVGGSASTDGGAGVLQALGARLTDARGGELRTGGAALASLADIDLTGLDGRIAQTTIVLASDVDNPLLGARGAAAVFGPQKGASAADVADLEAALSRWAKILEAQPGVRPSTCAPGAGAAGGVGYAALAVLGAHREPGIEVVRRLTGLDEMMRGADLVITGEGSLDEQSLSGKTPIGVIRIAAAAGLPVIVVCGRTTLTREQTVALGIRRLHAVTDLESDIPTAMEHARMHMVMIGRRIAAEAAEIVAPGNTAFADG